MPTLTEELTAAPAMTRPDLRPVEVALTVRDLDRVADFYRDAIGLQVIDRNGSLVRLGAGRTVLLDLLRQPDALLGDPRAAGLFHTAFLLPSRADLGSWLAHIHRIGHPLDGAADHLVSEAAYLHDPEGNGIEVYADRPASEWCWTDQDGQRRIVMANRPLDAEGIVASAAAPWSGAPSGTCIGHVHLRVGDVDQAQRFYGGLLGLDVTAQWPSAVFMSTGAYHHHIAANIWDSAGSGLRDMRRAGLASVTFEASDPAAIAHRTGVADPVHAGIADPWGTLLRFRLAS